MENGTEYFAGYEAVKRVIGGELYQVAKVYKTKGNSRKTRYEVMPLAGTFWGRDKAEWFIESKGLNVVLDKDA